MQHSIELSTAIAAAQAGSKIIAAHFKNLSAAGITTKSDNDRYDGLVTQADIDSEHAVVAEIKNAFPNHSFLAEEAHSDSSSAEHLWVIDPLDGTNNFAHGIPHFAVSVAYYQNGNAMSGAILDPMRGDLFIAEKGQGAYWNGNKIQVCESKSLEQTMIAVGFYYDRGPMMRATLKAIEELFQQNIHGIRRFGTAALDLVQVGLGRFGGFFEYELSPWDFAAARLFLEEAGGRITTCTGQELPLEKTSVLASNGLIHDSMLAIVSKHSNY
jgi:myo-inositol-1(or 4)-monophosphatase